MQLKEKLDKAREKLRDKKVLIAFSGGADSTLLVKLANESSLEAVAVTIDNGALPSDFIEKARSIAASIGIKHIILKENFLDDQNFRSNPTQRCYICKNRMYSILLDYLQEKNFDEIADGTNISDLLEDRPGIMAIYQKNISTPLVYGGLTEEDVRVVLNDLKIFYSQSTTCYATRIPGGTEITPQKIKKIERAEKLVKSSAGLEDVRVRDEDNQARIEVSDPDKLLNRETLNNITSELISLGFNKVLLDITHFTNQDKELVIYKPCRDEENKIMIETKLPYQINIPETCQEMEHMGEVKCSNQMGVAMIELDDSNITIFKKGKIVARRVKDRESAQDLLNKVLPLIRRII
jgi:pyridinium-3,5-biscarboxylic acid mononucleotide sulfurtransferase